MTNHDALDMRLNECEALASTLTGLKTHYDGDAFDLVERAADRLDEAVRLLREAERLVRPAPALNDETGHCTSCGRDNRGHEGEPCSDDCPMYDDPVAMIQDGPIVLTSEGFRPL